MKTFLALVSLTILLVQFSNAFKNIQEHEVYARQVTSSKNVTLNKEVDNMLMKLEKSIKDRDMEQFQKCFHDEFDSQAWFLRHYSELTQAQLDSFVIRRFAYVEPYGTNYRFKISESRIIGDDNFLLRSFFVTTKRMPTKPYAIVSMTLYGEY